MTITASQVSALIARLRAPLAPHDRPSAIEQLTDDAADTLADLLVQIGALKLDAKRYRVLSEVLHAAKAGGSVEVNQRLQYYEQPEPGKEVEIRWYDATPVAFFELSAATLDAAVDGLIDHQEGRGEIDG
jgi:hypothetical protein